MREIPVYVRRRPPIPVREMAVEILTVGTVALLFAAWKLIPWTQ